MSSKGIEWTYDGPESLSSQIHSVLSVMWFFEENVLDIVSITSTTSADAVTSEINRWTDESSKNGRAILLDKAKTNINDCL